MLKILTSKSFSYAFLLTFIASMLGKYLSTFPGLKLVGHLVLALIIGMVFQLLSPKVEKKIHEGNSFISNKFLRLGIILLGFKLNIEDLLNYGVKGIAVAIIVITFTIIVIYSLCKYFKIDEQLSILTACGCGICGAAAVMGIAPITKAKKDETILSIAAVCILGTLFTLIYVFFKPFLDLTEVQYGVFAGSSLHEIAHAVAAGSAGGFESLKIAQIFKLSRVLMLAPVALVISYIEYIKQSQQNKIKDKTKVPIPYFILGFILTSLLGTYMLSSYQTLVHSLEFLGFFLLGMAMSSLGMNINFQVIKEKGIKLLSVAFVGSILLSILAYILAKFLF